MLNVGRGPAHLGAYLAARGARVIGLDLGKLMLAEARRSGALKSRPPSLTCVSCPSPAGPARRLSFYVLHHLPRPELAGALAEFRGAGPGGELALAVHEGEGELVGNSDPLIMGTRLLGR